MTTRLNPSLWPHADGRRHAAGRAVAARNNLAVSLGGDDTEELRGYWQALSDGGTVTVELATQPWRDEFGMCIDRFGTSWLLNITGGD